MANVKRDQAICDLYRDGATQDVIAVEFGLSESRVGQIIKRAGLLPPKRAATGRTRFTALHLSNEAKEALRAEAKKDGVSMSAWVAALVTKELKDRGIDCEIKKFLEQEDAWLPLEG
ncbi:MAG: hypothetical protein NUV51_09465 [Sulfuricaulis sp.]|nr:hypothetical protein [Sulfuricaulis sp.]